MDCCDNCLELIPLTSIGVHRVRCLRYNFFCNTCKEAVPRVNADEHVKSHCSGLDQPQSSDHLTGSSSLALSDDGARVSIDPDPPKPKLSITPKPLHLCEFCEHGFVDLVEHIAECFNASKTEECIECHRRIQRRNMAKHLLDHLNNESDPSDPPPQTDQPVRHRCPDCDQEFTDYDEWTAHRVGLHDWTPESFECDVCQQIFFQNLDLELHRKYQGCTRGTACPP